MREDWKLTRLGDVCDFSRGLTYKKKDEVPISSNVVLRANNIDVVTGALDFSDLRYIRDDIAIPDSKQVVEGSLMICTASGSKKHLGKVALIDKDYGYAFGGFMGLLRPRAEINAKYLYWILSSPLYGDFIDQLSAGVNINNLKFSQLSALEFPLPPLSEQMHLAAILDELVVGIDAAIGNTKTNLTNAKELFESCLSNVFGRPGNKWVTMPLNSVCQLRNGRAFKKSELLSEGKYPVLRVGNFFSNPNWYYSDLELDPSKYCDSGDLLYAWSASFGPKIWDGGKVIYHYHIWRVDFDPSKMAKSFLYYWLEWDAERIKKEQGAGTTMVHVSKKSMEARLISLPSLADQDRIGEAIHDIESEIHLLEETQRAKLAALQQLKRSLLQQALSGKLLANQAKKQVAVA